MAETNQEVNKLYGHYLKKFNEEHKETTAFRIFIASNKEEDLYSRKNFVGHITASGFIVNRYQEILLLHHKNLNKWLQPGGHVDSGDESILAAAKREIEEETGIRSEKLQLYKLPYDIPFDIDSHAIPANNKKKEEAHVHHDVRYLFLLDEDLKIDLDESESLAYKWVSFDSLKEDEIFGNMIAKMRRVMDLTADYTINRL